MSVTTASTIRVRHHPVAAFITAMATITIAAVGTTTPVAASADPSRPVVVVEGGAVRGVAVSGGYAFRGLPYAAPPNRALCGGGLRGLQPIGPVCATRPSSRRAVRSRRASTCSSLRARSTRTASTSTFRRRRFAARPLFPCSCGSTGAASRRTPHATTTAPSSLPTAPWSSRSTTGSAPWASFRIRRWHHRETALRATTG